MWNLRVAAEAFFLPPSCTNTECKGQVWNVSFNPCLINTDSTSAVVTVKRTPTTPSCSPPPPHLSSPSSSLRLPPLSLRSRRLHRLLIHYRRRRERRADAVRPAAAPRRIVRFTSPSPLAPSFLSLLLPRHGPICSPTSVSSSSPRASCCHHCGSPSCSPYFSVQFLYSHHVVFVCVCVEEERLTEGRPQGLQGERVTAAAIED